MHQPDRDSKPNRFDRPREAKTPGKYRQLGEQFSPDDLATMQLVRAAFDPLGIFNPDKLFPTPRLCGDVPGRYVAHPLEARDDVGRG